ncbi:hypothetical protein JZ751_022445 [Albula glossodonta]|uniref:Uncharacterized protein n=1 Tax=Albula glossodonta TaxID=121402 RepID=A0A8T2NHP7_9TELE|nr:hypothetical protein JZ751_022445 [Albula glossodonta]
MGRFLMLRTVTRLKFVFGPSALHALDLVDQRAVTVLSSPSGRRVYQVKCISEPPPPPSHFPLRPCLSCDLQTAPKLSGNKDVLLWHVASLCT